MLFWMAQGQQTVECLHTPRELRYATPERCCQRPAGQDDCGLPSAFGAQLQVDKVPVAGIEYPLAVRFELPAKLSQVCAPGRRTRSPRNTVSPTFGQSTSDADSVSKHMASQTRLAGLDGWRVAGRREICPYPSRTLLFDPSRSDNNALQKVTGLSRIEPPPVPSPRLRTTGPSGRNLSAQLGSRLDVTATGEQTDERERQTVATG